jgi:beta-1,4-mannosyl-glycoprotein beta-1,4-N-acetylglucosaminyltransferase
MLVYDAFTYFNEDLLLEIRLEELNSIVDKFVICESTYTHAGNYKGLNFDINKYPKFKDKIIYIIDDNPPHREQVEVKKQGPAWENENHQREELKKGLVKCREGDIIIVSDLDEIPSLEGVKKAISMLTNDNLVEFQHKTYYYYVNYYVLDAPGGIIMKYDRFISEFKGSPQAVRNRWGMSKPNYLKLGSGWHFGYLGGLERVTYKLKNFAHQEYNNEVALNTVINDKETMLDMHKRKIIKVPLDNTFPAYLINNKERFKNFINE